MSNHDRTMQATPRMTLEQFEAQCQRGDTFAFALGLAIGGAAGCFAALLILCYLI